MNIPHIIHQIWSDKNLKLPKLFLDLSDTWKNEHKDWQYIYWNDAMLEKFLQDNFPQYIPKLLQFPYDIQRWDAIRYLILYQYGGVYIDFDMECLKNITPLLKGNCCFGTDVKSNIVFSSLFEGDYINNAFIATIPKHPFFAKIIDKIFNQSIIYNTSYKLVQVLQSTGAIMLSNLNNESDEKVYIIPAEYISPFSISEIHSICLGKSNQEWDKRIEKAFAIHYFMGTWKYLS